MSTPRRLLLLLLVTLLPAGAPAQTSDTLVPAVSQISDREARRQLARLLSYRTRSLQESAGQYRLLLKEDPQDAEMRYELADVLFRLGRKNEAKAELRTILASEPDNARVAFKLADLEADSGHAAAANALYLRYAGSMPQDVGVGLRYGQQMRSWGDFDRAEELYLRYLQSHPHDLKIQLELAEMLASSQRYEEAEGMYRRILKKHPRNVTARNGLTRTKLLEKDYLEAQTLAAETARLHPGNREARRHAVVAEEGLDKRAEAAAGFQRDNLRDPEEAAAAWAARQEQLQRTLNADPNLYAPRLELAEVLAAQERYDEALEQLDLLQKDFPQTFKVLLTRARVLSWAKRYEDSLEVYEQLSALNSKNPVPVKEMARVASWAKDRKQSHTHYSRLFSTPVDTQWNGTEVEDGKPPYAEFEKAWSDAGRPSDRLLDLHAAYRIQKAAYLEDRAKGQTWDKRFLRGEDTFQELVEFQPGNQEALFDLAQAQCAQGLGIRKVETYQQLLALDPYHTRSIRALRMHDMRNHPSVQSDYWYWREDGRGGLSDVQRHVFRGSAEFRFFHQYYARIGENIWLEYPGDTGAAYQAHGPTFETGGVFNEYLSGALSFTYKNYFQSDISDTYTGSATLNFNAWDYVKLLAQYERVDELHNQFGYLQGTQSDSYSVGFLSNVTRQFEITGRATYRHYTDGNQGRIVTLSPAYSFTEHPRIFKVTLTGEYRDTDEESEFVYRGGSLTNIIHPYWTPQDYLKGAVTLEWYHDLSHEFFCGAEQHFYDLKINLGTDTERNPGIGLEGEWLFEFQEHWAVHLQGTLFRSFEWNGETAWASLRYRF